ncbi:zinc-binding alcohol dehydrogenase family protein [Duganella aquatilis]|nr:zinc-binding alcohol dehydrogenase family protein [Duganella aquatilis]
MKAIGFDRSLPIQASNSLFMFDAAYPEAAPYDLIVKVSAASVNPVDAKVRVRAAADGSLETPRVLGYDAVGTVVEVGASVTGFEVGSRVYYAGEINRAGSNARYQAVDSRLVGKAPVTLGDAEAAALPLTALTGWEALFDRLRIGPDDADKTLLVIGGAGGVGSITIQLAKQLTRLRVIATASRPESAAWCRSMGADHIADHVDLVKSVRALGIETVDYILNAADTIVHWDAMAELIAPQGTICSIVEFDGGVDLTKLQGKSAGFVWELMFTRSLFKTADIAKQADILDQVSRLADQGKLRSTLMKTLAGFTVESFKMAHQEIESGKTIGKISITY